MISRQVRRMEMGMTTHVPHLVTLALLGALASGCKSSEPAKPDSTKSEAAAAPPLAIASAAIAAAAVTADAGVWPSSDTPIKSFEDPRFGALPLFTKLGVERSNRPAGTLTAEKVFEAVSAKYGALKNRTQLAGFTIHAGYCEKADTAHAVDVVVCEYHSADKLAKGKASALKNDVPRREILTVKTSTVSITRFTETKDAADQAKGIAEIVKTL